MSNILLSRKSNSVSDVSLVNALIVITRLDTNHNDVKFVNLVSALSVIAMFDHNINFVNCVSAYSALSVTALLCDKSNVFNFDIELNALSDIMLLCDKIKVVSDRVITESLVIKLSSYNDKLVNDVCIIRASSVTIETWFRRNFLRFRLRTESHIILLNNKFNDFKRVNCCTALSLIMVLLRKFNDVS
jgi:hypothetical protein